MKLLLFNRKVIDSCFFLKFFIRMKIHTKYTKIRFVSFKLKKIKLLKF